MKCPKCGLDVSCNIYPYECSIWCQGCRVNWTKWQQEENAKQKRGVERLNAGLEKTEDLLHKANLMAKTDREELSRLQGLLDEIANHPHLSPRNVPDEEFQANYEPNTREWLAVKKAISAGHRCAAAIARKGRKP